MLHIKVVDTENGDVLVDDRTACLMLGYDVGPKTRGVFLTRESDRETVLAVSAQTAETLADAMHGQVFE